MNGNYANCFVEKEQKPARIDIKEASELFSKMSPAAQEKIIDLIKSLLSKK